MSGRIVKLGAPFIGLLLLCIAGCTSTDYIETNLASNLPDRIEIFYFYDEICTSCTNDFDFHELFHEMAGDVSEMYPYMLIPVNVARTNGRRLFEETMASFGHSTNNINFPLMMVGSWLFQGEESIRNNIREAFLVEGEDIFVNEYVFNQLNPPTPLHERFKIYAEHNTIIYFYRIVCPACIELEPFIDALPEYVAIDGENIPVNVVRINTRSGNNGNLVRAFLEYYNVPHEDQFVPIIFLRDMHLTGVERIRTELLDLLAEGAGLGFELTQFGGN
ncbi:MAG: hypothetical protein FWE24_08255 [Defluviitaleaceae bacterium]|nr:hypothetical protein [Defluviitaleaceae bacterium]